MKKIFIYLLMSAILSLTLTFAGSHEYIIKSDNDQLTLSRSHVEGIVEKALASYFKTTTFKVIVRIVNDNKTQIPLYLTIYSLQSDSYEALPYKLELDKAGNVTKIVPGYEESVKEDYIPIYSYACPDDSIEAFFETSHPDVSSALTGINEYYTNATTGKIKYKAIKIIDKKGSTATVMKNYMSCPNIKLIGRIGHGSTSAILFADGSSINATWFKGLAKDYFKNTVLVFNSCQVHNEPMQASVLASGPIFYIGGDINLAMGPSEKSSACFIKEGCNGSELKTALLSTTCNGGNNGFGYSGNPTSGPWYMPPAGNGPTATPSPTKTPTPTLTPTPTPTTTPSNIALLGQVTASSYVSGYEPTNVNDNSLATAWGVEAKGQPYLYINLKKSYIINKVKIRWYNPYFASKYDLGAMINGTWAIMTVTNNGDIDEYDVTSSNISTQYIGIRFLNGATGYYGIKEFEIYGKKID